MSSLLKMEQTLVEHTEINKRLCGAFYKISKL